MADAEENLKDFEVIAGFYENVGKMLTAIFKTQQSLLGASVADCLQEIHSFASDYPPHELIDSPNALQILDVSASMLLKDLNALKDSKLRGDTIELREVLVKTIQYSLRPLIKRRVGDIPLAEAERAREKREIELLTIRARELIRQMASQVLEVERIKNTTAEVISRTDADVKSLISRVDGIESLADEKLLNIDSLYEDSLRSVIDKEEQVNQMLGHLSGRAISGDFENNAADEKGMANNLRYASVFCMFLVVSIAGYSFFESTKEGFDWGSQISRFLLMLLITVPAAYLARESERHRRQHYNYLQKSLDLKTITPFLASLPEEEQHRIKAQIAGKLFVSTEITASPLETFPINTQELILELLKKVELASTKVAK